MLASVIADTPEGTYPLSALLMTAKKLAEKMLDLLLRQLERDLLPKKRSHHLLNLLFMPEKVYALELMFKPGNLSLGTGCLLLLIMKGFLKLPASCLECASVDPGQLIKLSAICVH